MSGDDVIKNQTIPICTMAYMIYPFDCSAQHSQPERYVNVLGETRAHARRCHTIGHGFPIGGLKRDLLEHESNRIVSASYCGLRICSADAATRSSAVCGKRKAKPDRTVRNDTA